MITQSLASLVLQSDSEPTSAVTRLLGIEPHRAHEIGDLTWAGRHPGRSNGRTEYDYAHWSYTVERELTPPDDETGFWSIRELIRIFEPLVGPLRELRPAWASRITWSGFSDSWQGGFVIPADVFAGLARLDCDIYATAYLDDPAEADGPSLAD